jgi:hypothetical protein
VISPFVLNFGLGCLQEKNRHRNKTPKRITNDFFIFRIIVLSVNLPYKNAKYLISLHRL